jgi:hypothetical protein
MTVGILIALATGIAVMEAYAWLDAIAVWLMNRAATHIVKIERDRYREEWAADLNAIPNSFYKLVYAATNFRRSVAYDINSIFVAYAMDRLEEIASQGITGLDELTQEVEDLRVKFNSRNRSDSFQNRFGSVLDHHRAFGACVDKIVDLKRRLGMRATKVDSAASADAWLDEIGRGLDEITALFPITGVNDKDIK